MRKTNIIFATIVALALIFFDGPLAKQLIEQYFSTGYPSTTGQVTHSEVSSYKTFGGTTVGAHIHYFPKVRYNYEINDQTNEGKRFCYISEYGEEFSEKIVTEYPVGSRIQVFYNPRNPQDALLSPGFGQIDSTAVIQTLIQANFVVIVLIVVWRVKIYKQGKLSEKPLNS